MELERIIETIKIADYNRINGNFIDNVKWMKLYHSFHTNSGEEVKALYNLSE